MWRATLVVLTLTVFIAICSRCHAFGWIFHHPHHHHAGHQVPFVVPSAALSVPAAPSFSTDLMSSLIAAALSHASANRQPTEPERKPSPSVAKITIDSDVKKKADGLPKSINSARKDLNALIKKISDRKDDPFAIKAVEAGLKTLPKLTIQQASKTSSSSGQDTGSRVTGAADNPKEKSEPPPAKDF